MRFKVKLKCSFFISQIKPNQFKFNKTNFEYKLVSKNLIVNICLTKVSICFKKIRVKTSKQNLRFYQKLSSFELVLLCNGSAAIIVKPGIIRTTTNIRNMMAVQKDLENRATKKQKNKKNIFFEKTDREREGCSRKNPLEH